MADFLPAALSAAGGIIPQFFGDNGEEELRRALARIAGVKDPQLNRSQITPELLRFLGLPDPEVAAAILPELVEAEGTQESRQEQVGALQHFKDASRSGLTQSERLDLQSAGDEISAQDQAAQNAIIEGLSRRGRLGAGDEVQARLLASQQGRDLRGTLGRNLQKTALDRRDSAAFTAANISDGIRRLDASENSAAATRANQFNEIVAEMGNRSRREATDTRNRFAAASAAERQRVHGFNVANRQETAERNIDRGNELALALSNFRLRRESGAAGINESLARVDQARGAGAVNAGSQLGQAAGAGILEFLTKKKNDEG